MKTFQLVRQAALSLARYRLRTVLMMLGVVVGIASLAILTSIGEATKRETMQRFKNMIGTFDTIMVRPGGGRSRGMPTLLNVPPTLRFEDSKAIAELPEIKSVAEMQSAFDIDIKYRDKAASPAVFGVSVNWLSLRSDEMADGVFFTEGQNTSLARVAVIGTDVRSALFPDEEPLGAMIRIAEVPFQVIGVLKSRGAGPAGGSLDNVILIPSVRSASAAPPLKPRSPTGVSPAASAEVLIRRQPHTALRRARIGVMGISRAGRASARDERRRW